MRIVGCVIAGHCRLTESVFIINYMKSDMQHFNFSVSKMMKMSSSIAMLIGYFWFLFFHDNCCDLLQQTIYSVNNLLVKFVLFSVNVVSVRRVW